MTKLEEALELMTRGFEAQRKVNELLIDTLRTQASSIESIAATLKMHREISGNLLTINQNQEQRIRELEKGR